VDKESELARVSGLLTTRTFTEPRPGMRVEDERMAWRQFTDSRAPCHTSYSTRTYGSHLTPGITRPLLPLMMRAALLRVGCMPLLDGVGCHSTTLRRFLLSSFVPSSMNSFKQLAQRLAVLFNGSRVTIRLIMDARPDCPGQDAGHHSPDCVRDSRR